MAMSQAGRQDCEVRITEKKNIRGSQWEKSSRLHRKSEKNKDKA